MVKALAAAAALALAGTASATIGYDSRTTTGADGAFFNSNTHFMQVVTLNTPVTAQTLNGMILGVRWLANGTASQGIIVNFWSDVDESPTSTDALAGATLLASRNYTVGIQNQGSYDYTLPIGGQIINVNKIGVEVYFTNAAFTQLSTQLGGRVTTGTPTVGSNDGFYYTDPNPPATTTFDNLFQGTERTRVNGAVNTTTPQNTNVRMMLDVTVPAPGAAGLLGVAGLVAVRRRR
jgi:hypothetical protein